MSARAWSEAALAYFRAHAISPELAALCGVREEGLGLIFPWPIADGGWSWRKRSLNDAARRWQQEPGVSHQLSWITGWEAAAMAQGRTPGSPVDKGAVLIAEGPADALAALSAMWHAPADSGLYEQVNAVAALPSASYRADRLAAELQAAGAAEAVLTLDGDTAGNAAAARLAEGLRAEGVRVAVLELRNGVDLADCLSAANARGSCPASWLAHAVADACAAAEEEQPPAQMGSAQHAGDHSAHLRFRSPRELRAAAPAEEPWVWEGYLSRGAITALAGKPKVGKSTLVASLIEAVAGNARSFLGRGVQGGPVVYVSEEAAGTLMGKLPELEGLRVLTRDAAWPRPSWAELVAASVDEARRVNAALIVVDTFAYWSALPPEREKDAGAVQEAMAALVEAAAAGLAVGVVLHQRKAGGENGDAVRGSSAFAGAVDAIVEYERPARDAAPSQRQLVALSRWMQTPPLLVVELDRATASWRIVGEGDNREDAVRVGVREGLLNAAPTEPAGASEQELANALGLDRRKVGGPLRALVSDGHLLRSGSGKKGSPYLYWRPPDEGAPQSCPDGGAQTRTNGARPLAAPPPESRRDAAGSNASQPNLPVDARGTNGGGTE